MSEIERGDELVLKDVPKTERGHQQVKQEEEEEKKEEKEENFFSQESLQRQSKEPESVSGDKKEARLEVELSDDSSNDDQTNNRHITNMCYSNFAPICLKLLQSQQEKAYQGTRGQHHAHLTFA